MKKYLSVFSLFVRSSFPTVLLLSVISSLIQIFMFKAKVETLRQWDGSTLGFEPILESTKASVIFIIFFIITALALSIFSRENSEKCGYTIRRLSIKEKGFLMMHSAYNFMALVAYLVITFIGILVMFEIYCKKNENINTTFPGFISNQTLFLATFRSDYLHNLMPVSDIVTFGKNLIYVLGTALCSAALPYFQRRKAIPYEALLFIALAGFTYIISWDQLETELFSLTGASILLIILIVRLKGANEKYEN